VNEEPKVCTKCGGELVTDDGEIKCRRCYKAHRSPSESRKFIASNTGEILRDAAVLGATGTAAKWGISAGAVYDLVDAAGVKMPTYVKHGQSPKAQKAPVSRVAGVPADPPLVKPILPVESKAKPFDGDGNRVDFPDWDDKWPPEVKVSWLNTYAVMASTQSEERIARRKCETELEIAKKRE